MISRQTFSSFHIFTSFMKYVVFHYSSRLQNNPYFWTFLQTGGHIQAWGVSHHKLYQRFSVSIFVLDLSWIITKWINCILYCLSLGLWLHVLQVQSWLGCFDFVLQSASYFRGRAIISWRMLACELCYEYWRFNDLTTYILQEHAAKVLHHLLQQDRSSALDLLLVST